MKCYTEKMKNSFLTFLTRIILVLVFIAALIWLGLWAAQRLQTIDQTVVTVEQATSSAALEFVDGQQMNGDSFNLTTNLEAPAATLLPLKTLADFPATIAAQTATVKTNRGSFTIELFVDQAPLTTMNFITLAENNFYDGLKFHRVEPDFVVQVGDPESSRAATVAELATLGTGYPGYRIMDEIVTGLSHDQAGVVSMANINLTGEYPNTGGSQFFITLAPLTYLDGRHAIFGRVTKGMDVVTSLVVGDEIEDIIIE